MRRLSAQWARKGNADSVAGKLAQERAALHDPVCFHGQQSAEKYLKALMEELSLPVPCTHNLVAILPLLTPP